MSRIVTSNGTIIYRNENGRYHREDGPAVIYKNGSEQWFINGKLHREDGPAAIHSDGTERWLINGLYHRDDGPAVMHSSGEEHWYRNNENITELVKDHVHNWRNWTDKEKLSFKLKFM